MGRLPWLKITCALQLGVFPEQERREAAEEAGLLLQGLAAIFL